MRDRYQPQSFTEIKASLACCNAREQDGFLEFFKNTLAPQLKSTK